VGRVAQLVQHLLQAAAVNHFHGEEQASLSVGAQLVDGHDVGMFEPSGDLRFLDETHFLAWIGLVEQILDGHFAADVAIDGAEDGAHAAAGDLAFEQIALSVGLACAQHFGDRPCRWGVAVGYSSGKGNVAGDAGAGQAAERTVDA
jgi:hypothetical protein